MGFKAPPEITETSTEKGVTKATLPIPKMLVGGFLAGAYIAFAGIVAVATTAGMPQEIWGTLPTFFAGVVFVLGLVLVVVAGSELLTGNMALVPLAALQGDIKWSYVLKNFTWILLGNLIGSLFVAYFLAVQSGVLTTDLAGERLGAIATQKAVDETSWEIFLRAMGCNWLVCLAVWMAFAAEDIAGKILAIFFPIMAFVAIGFDHVVANMFFLPAAIFAGVGDLGWLDALRNWFFAFWGNLAGGAIFVGGAYWFLYGRDDDEPDPGDQPQGDEAGGRARTGDGRYETSGNGVHLPSGAESAERR